MEDNRPDSDINMSEAAETAGAAVAADTPEANAPSLEEVKRQRDDYYDRLLRKTAEFDNFRKRIERERQQLSEAAAADLIEEILPLLDDLDRAIKADAGPEGAAAYRRGVELIHARLADVLRKRGVRPIDAVGADFDPHFHQAV